MPDDEDYYYYEDEDRIAHDIGLYVVFEGSGLVQQYDIKSTVSMHFFSPPGMPARRLYILPMFFFFIFIYTPCLKKNDNDVAHYNFNAH